MRQLVCKRYVTHRLPAAVAMALVFFVAVPATSDQPVVLRLDGPEDTASTPNPFFEREQDTDVELSAVDVDREALEVSVERVRELHHNFRPELTPPVTQGAPLESGGNAARTSTAALAALGQDAEQQARALESLALMDSALSTSFALRTTGEDDSAELAPEALAPLASMSPETLHDHLLQNLTTASDDYIAALGASVYRFKESLAEPLLATLNNRAMPSAHRAAAAYLLGRMPATSAIPTLEDTAWEKDLSVAEASATALWRMNDLPLYQTWEKLLRHPALSIRGVALVALAELRTPGAADHLQRAARGAMGVPIAMQTYALDLLAGLPPELSVPRMIEVMGRNFTLRTRAWKHLINTTGEWIPEVPAEWERWYTAMTTPPQPPPLAPAGPVDAPPPSDLLGEVEFVPPPLR